VLTHPSRNTGLYAIITDKNGERSFAYWRDTSAAREVFALPGSAAALAVAAKADLLCFSLISLAILPPSGRNVLMSLAQAVRSRGGKVAFDSNYRPSLWIDAEEARRVRDAAIMCADIGLPTLDDEIIMSGAQDADAVSRHWSALGCRETIVKLGPLGCQLPDGTRATPPAVLIPVDPAAPVMLSMVVTSARVYGAHPAHVRQVSAMRWLAGASCETARYRLATLRTMRAEVPPVLLPAGGNRLRFRGVAPTISAGLSRQPRDRQETMTAPPGPGTHRPELSICAALRSRRQVDGCWPPD
jgi:hypothetical protein